MMANRQEGNAAIAGPKAKYPKPPPPPKLVDDAVRDHRGRQLCYAYVRGQRSEPCPRHRYHGPETPAMREKRLADEKKIAERRSAGQDATQTDVESGSETAVKPKAKAKTKQGPKAK